MQLSNDNRTGAQLPTGQPLDLRVVALTHYLPPYMARVLFHISQQLTSLKILLSIQQEPNRQFGNTWDGLDVSVQKSVMLRRPWKHETGFQEDLYVHFPYDTFGQLRRSNAQIVFSYEMGFRSLVSAAYCRLYRRKLALCVCVSEHTERGRGSARRVLRRGLLRAADAVTYNGPSCKAYLAGYGVPQEKLFHFPYATSDQFHYTGPLQRSPESDHHLLCIGQLSQRKGVQPLVESLTTYCRNRPSQQVNLTMVGTGPLAEPLAQMELPNNLALHLIGHLDYQAMADVMSRCGILVFPTKADEWGLVVNEGMQAGLPVLGSVYAQASTTLIEEGKTGWTYNPDDQAQLHQKLDQIFSLSPEQLLPMRTAATQRVAPITAQSSANAAIRMFSQI